MSAIEMQTHLRELQAELALSHAEGLEGNDAYMADLSEEISEVRHAYIAVAVTEIAVLRAELSAPLVG
jgi:hypothetical protein